MANSLTAKAFCILPDVAKNFDRARAVFTGEVEAITLPRSYSRESPFFERAHLIEFSIEKSWKGMPFGYLKVWADLRGYEATLTSISKGERYLVYADSIVENGVATGELVVGMCNRTALMPRNAVAARPFSLEFDGRNAARDVRVLDGLMFLKRR